MNQHMLFHRNCHFWCRMGNSTVWKFCNRWSHRRIAHSVRGITRAKNKSLKLKRFSAILNWFFREIILIWTAEKKEHIVAETNCSSLRIIPFYLCVCFSFCARLRVYVRVSVRVSVSVCVYVYNLSNHWHFHKPIKRVPHFLHTIATCIALCIE